MMFGWGAMFTLAALVSIYALAALAFPALRSEIIRGRLVTLPLALVAHLAASAVALVAGALQHHRGLRDRHRAFHRALGRVYVACVLFGGAAALVLATESVGGPVTHVAFALLAVLWMTSTGIAFGHVRAGRIALHRAWMTRSYSLTLAAVTLRLYLAASLVLGLPYVESYQAIAWLCWVPNLVLIEWVVLPRMRANVEG
jgi:uncharacterized membrane protein